MDKKMISIDPKVINKENNKESLEILNKRIQISKKNNYADLNELQSDIEKLLGDLVAETIINSNLEKYESVLKDKKRKKNKKLIHI